MIKNKTAFFVYLFSVFTTIACAPIESHQTVDINKTETYQTPYAGEKTTLSVGNFENRSNYRQGIFSSGTDRLGSQATTILKTHLQQTNRFNVVDRENLTQAQQEAKYRQQQQKIKGARYIVTGAITEFGRKSVGDKQLFGILGSGKTQVAYAKVSLNLVDIVTSQIIYSTQGAAKYSLSQREVLGFGTDASYDATLTGKVLNLAITETVNNITRDIQHGSLIFEQ
ncbi:curli production assembly protein CsgG [Candidatus Endobugula sertula]|uniref:Curli production assembly/transport component CsgG n=1 Tax=Candidatus Endobugula sertula TaxID=62101 RepID=A0A1D2QSZ0_9GAMM|nr:curli production assembly protein CsgG [Candidatus Endobugula sertula]